MTGKKVQSDGDTAVAKDAGFVVAAGNISAMKKGRYVHQNT